MNRQRAEDLVAALELMMRLRSELAYRSRGFMILNHAMWHVNNGFWREAGAPSEATVWEPRAHGASAVSV